MSRLATELRELHAIFAGYGDDGFTIDARGMPQFVAMLDYFATRAEREDKRREAKDDLHRIRDILAAIGVESQAYGGALDRHERAIADAIETGKVAVLRPAIYSPPTAAGAS